MKVEIYDQHLFSTKILKAVCLITYLYCTSRFKKDNLLIFK